MSASCCSHKPSSNQTIAPSVPLGEKIKIYRPLFVIALVSLLAGVVVDYTGRAPFMDQSMGLFWVLVAVLKLFDTAAFAQMFARYDLVGGKIPLYAKAYPFIELAVGVMYLAGAWPVTANVVAIVICAIAVFSVMRVITTGRIVNCACIGAGFALPVGNVTLFEYATMGIMAALNLLLIGAM